MLYELEIHWNPLRNELLCNSHKKCNINPSQRHHIKKNPKKSISEGKSVKSSREKNVGTDVKESQKKSTKKTNPVEPKKKVSQISQKSKMKKGTEEKKTRKKKKESESESSSDSESDSESEEESSSEEDEKILDNRNKADDDLKMRRLREMEATFGMTRENVPISVQQNQISSNNKSQNDQTIKHKKENVIEEEKSRDDQSKINKDSINIKNGDHLETRPKPHEKGGPTTEQKSVNGDGKSKTNKGRDVRKKKTDTSDVIPSTEQAKISLITILPSTIKDVEVNKVESNGVSGLAESVPSESISQDHVITSENPSIVEKSHTKKRDRKDKRETHKKRKITEESDPKTEKRKRHSKEPSTTSKRKRNNEEKQDEIPDIDQGSYSVNEIEHNQDQDIEMPVSVISTETIQVSPTISEPKMQHDESIIEASPAIHSEISHEILPFQCPENSQNVISILKKIRNQKMFDWEDENPLSLVPSDLGSNPTDKRTRSLMCSLTKFLVHYFPALLEEENI